MVEYGEVLVWRDGFVWRGVSMERWLSMKSC